MNFLDAFKALDALNEDTYSLDGEGIKKLKEFQDTDDLTDEVTVIDVDAETEEDLSDSYVGKVILDCSVCHSKLYKGKDEVEIDEEQQLANVGEECPYCYTSDGFKVIGEVSPFNSETEVEEETTTDDEQTDEPELAENINESLIAESKLGEDIEELTQDIEACEAEKTNSKNDLEEATALADRPGTIAHALKDSMDDLATVSNIGEMKQKVIDVVKASDVSDKEKSRAIAIFMKPKSATALLSTIGTFMTGIKTESLNESMRGDKLRLNAEILDVLGMNGYDVDSDDVISLADAATELAFEEYLMDTEKSLEQIAKDWLQATKENYPEDLAGLTKFNESLTEDINNLSLDTDDTHMEMTSDESGKVTITTEPIENQSNDSEGETIVPISDETEAEILSNDNSESDINDADTINETDTEVEIDIDEFDEESFDDLGESYFKKIYENVDSFKTSSVKKADTSLIVEGILNIDGKSKKTNFIFESKDTNKSGRVRFIGENKEVTNGCKAFTLRGKVQDNKFICESLNYNYKVTDEGKSRRVYGIVTRKD